jgi:hypothetical protein
MERIKPGQFVAQLIQETLALINYRKLLTILRIYNAHILKISDTEQAEGTN